VSESQAARAAVVLSHSDINGGAELLLHNCEDCACAVSGQGGAAPIPVTSAASALGDDRAWTCAPEVVEIRLDPEHLLLFNPVGDGSPAVVNALAYSVFRGFADPTTVRAVAASPPAGGDGDDVTATFSRLRQLSLIQQAGLPVRPEFAESGVLTAWLHVTNACNLRCPYCYVHKSAEKMDEATGTAAVEAVVESAVRHGFSAVKLKYAGGEASLNYRLMVRLQRLARELTARHGLRLEATLLSNGVALPGQLIETIEAEGIKVMISLDGIGEQHDRQRPTINGRASFPLVRATIARLVERGLAPHLSITITDRNMGGLADVVRFALDQDLTFSLNFFRDNECAASFADLQYAEKGIIEAMLAAFAVIEERLPRWSVLGAVLDRGQLLERRQRSCGVGQDYVVIDQHGGVAKCHMEIERTLGDIFSSDPLALVRADRSSALNLAVEEKEGCRTCAWRYSCSGGCTIATFRATGRYDVKSPNCNIYKTIYPAALKLEGLRLLKYATAGRGLVPASPDLPAAPDLPQRGPHEQPAGAVVPARCGLAHSAERGSAGLRPGVVRGGRGGTHGGGQLLRHQHPAGRRAAG
jgi:uncharacterized protein